jgi:hypothetical protein
MREMRQAHLLGVLPHPEENGAGSPVESIDTRRVEKVHVDSVLASEERQRIHHQLDPVESSSMWRSFSPSSSVVTP